MKMTSQEFEQAMRENRLVMTFVGMSNIGKTYWSKQLAAKRGFQHINCDDRIEAVLASELKALGFAGGIADVSRWMGQPYDQRYPANQQRYLDIEAEVTRGALEEIDRTPGNTAVDTTGSVIHLDPSIGKALEQKTFVVCIRATPEMKDQMFQRYIKEPKPVVFGNVFKKLPAESDHDALARSYKELLEYRSGLYEQLADVVLPRESIPKGIDLTEFMALVKKHCDLPEH